MAQVSENPLVSSKPSDSGITVLLHPLVLLTASDQITRHKVRGESDPIAGILLGQQDGRQITAEHAFSAGFDKDDKTGKLTFKQPWLQERVQQCKLARTEYAGSGAHTSQIEMSTKHRRSMSLAGLLYVQRVALFLNLYHSNSRSHLYTMRLAFFSRFTLKLSNPHKVSTRSCQSQSTKASPR